MKNNLFKMLLVVGVFSFTPIFVLAGGELAPPEIVVGLGKNESVFLQWSEVANVNDYKIEYKEASNSFWNVYEDGTSLVRGINILNLENDISYNFRISSIVNNDSSEPSQVVSVTPIVGFDNQNSNTQIISTGQSNALGSFALPYLSVTQPFNNKMLNIDRTAFIPLIEPATGVVASATGESMSSSLANSITSFTGGENSNYFPITMSLRGYGGLIYTSLMQGTNYYNALIQDVVSSTNLSLNQNKTNIVRALTVVHGESDEYFGTSVNQYEDYLLEWQNDYEMDVKNITGQEESIPLFLNQISSHHSYGHSTPTIAISQLNATKNNPDKIILVTPSYIFDSSDWMSHMRNYSYRRLGEYFAKVYKKVVIDNESWKPLMPEEVNFYGNVIRARFHVPVPPLVFDTNAVLFKENYGFEYYDSTSSATITNVQIINDDTVEVTLSNIPTGENPRLRYAYTGNVGSWTGSHISNAPRGNLRDSDTTEAPHQDGTFPAYVGNYLYNWSVTFDESIDNMNSMLPVQPENVTATLGYQNGSAEVSFDYPDNSEYEIDHFVIKPIPGNVITITSSSPVTVVGLSNHTEYTFKVIAVNSYGESQPSYSNIIETNWTEYPTFPAVINPKPAIHPIPYVDIAINKKMKSGASIIENPVKVPEDQLKKSTVKN